MKTLLLAATSLALLAGSAFAQNDPTPPPPPPTQAAPGDDAAAPPPPPGDEAGADDDDMGGPPPPPRDMGPKGRHGPRGDHEGRRGPPPPPSKAAHFRLAMGKARLDVKCAEDEPMKACADIVMQLLDRAAQMKLSAPPAGDMPAAPAKP